jgi:glycosyltransferase involved in cell wall biosynthesis
MGNIINKLTIVVLFYNQRAWVKDIFNDIVSQNFEDFSVILSDDASTDGTYEILKYYCDRYIKNINVIKKIKYVRCEKNQGVVGHLNSILPLIDTEFVGFVAGDDRLHQDYCNVLMGYFSYGVSCVTSNQLRINRYGSIIDRSKWNSQSIFNVYDVVKKESFGVPSAGSIFKTAVIAKYGLIPNNLINEDDQLLFRALLEGERVISKEHLFLYRVHSSSLSSWHRKYQIKPEILLKILLAEEVNRINNLKNWSDLLMKSKNFKVYIDANKIKKSLSERIVIHNRRLSTIKFFAKHTGGIFFLWFCHFCSAIIKLVKFKIGIKVRRYLIK